MNSQLKLEKRKSLSILSIITVILTLLIMGSVNQTSLVVEGADEFEIQPGFEVGDISTRTPKKGIGWGASNIFYRDFEPLNVEWVYNWGWSVTHGDSTSPGKDYFQDHGDNVEFVPMFWCNVPSQSRLDAEVNELGKPNADEGEPNHGDGEINADYDGYILLFNEPFVTAGKDTPAQQCAHSLSVRGTRKPNINSELQLNNALLRIAFSSTVKGVSFGFNDSDSKIILRVNPTSYSSPTPEFENMPAAHQTQLFDPIDVKVKSVHYIADENPPLSFDTNRGITRLTGNIDEIAIGGESLRIDYICAFYDDITNKTTCINFDNLIVDEENDPPSGGQEFYGGAQIPVQPDISSDVFLNLMPIKDIKWENGFAEAINSGGNASITYEHANNSRQLNAELLANLYAEATDRFPNAKFIGPSVILNGDGLNGISLFREAIADRGVSKIPSGYAYHTYAGSNFGDGVFDPDIDIYNNEDYINLAGSEPGDPDDNIELDPGDRFENFREELAIQDGFEAESWLTEFGYCGANNWQVTKLMIEEMEIGRLDYIDRYSPFLTRTDMWRTYGGYLEVSESETPNISANQCDPGRYYHPDDNRYMFSESNAHLCSSIPTMEPDDPICSYIDCSINEHPNLQDFYIAFADEIDQNEAEGRKKAERAWVHASEAFCRNYTNSFSDTYWTFYDVSNDLEMKPLGHWYKNFDPATLSNDPPSDTLPIEPDH